MPGIELIRAERVRQIHTEHYKQEGDVGRSEELAQAAAAYALSAAGDFVPHETWPENWSQASFKPHTARKDLIRAGALIAAALDALEEEG